MKADARASAFCLRSSYLYYSPMLLIEIKQNTCDFCGCCVGVCPEDAIELEEAHIEIVEERCTNCAKCVWVCPFEALIFHKPNKERAAA